MKNNEFMKGVLFTALFVCILFAVDYYNKNTEEVLSMLGKDSLFMSNALTLEEFKETYGWGVQDLQVLENQSGITFSIAANGKDIYAPNRYWYTSIGVKSYAMKLSLRAKIDREPLTLQHTEPSFYTVPFGSDNIGTGTRQAITKFRVDGEDFYWVLLYNVDHKNRISDLESRILVNKR